MHIRKSGRGMTEGNIAPAISRAGDRLVQRPPDSDRGGGLDQVDDLRARASEVLDPNASATLFRESDPPGNVRISANITAWCKRNEADLQRPAQITPTYLHSRLRAGPQTTWMLWGGGRREQSLGRRDKTQVAGLCRLTRATGQALVLP